MTTLNEIKKEVDKTRESCKWVLQEFYYPADLWDSDFRGAINELRSALRHAEEAYRKQKAYWNEVSRGEHHWNG